MAWMNRIANLLRGRELDRELEDELQFHLEARKQDNIAAGMPPQEAEAAASRMFGNRTLVKEKARAMNILTWLETIAQDVQYALRGLRRAPGFAATAILSVALGIGASVSIFTVADNLLLRPLPYKDAGRLMMVWEAVPAGDIHHNVISPANFLDWKAQNDVFESMAVFQEGHSVLVDGDRTEDFERQAIGLDLLPMLGIHTIRGRLFTAQDGAPARSSGALLISFRLWHAWFGGAEDVIGRKVLVDSMPYTITGVLPPGFYFRNRNTDLWSLLTLDPARNYRQTSGRYLSSLAKLKPGIMRDRAQVEMTAIAKRLEAAYPGFNHEWTVEIEPLRDSLTRQVRASILVLLSAVGLLLVVACANVANLLLARYASRRQELSVRSSLGAGRLRVIRQLLVESILLGLAGGMLGLVFVQWSVAGLIALAPRSLTQSMNIVVDSRILMFAVLLSVVTGIIFGIAPSLSASRGELLQSLNDGSRSITGKGRLRGVLVSAEVALSVMLLAGAGLLFRTLIRLQDVNPGLDASRMLTARIRLPGMRYRNKSTQFFAEAIDRVSKLPGVRAASAVSYLPFDGDAAGTGVTIAGRPPAKLGEGISAVIRTVMPEYFRTMGIPLERGRDFTPQDDLPNSPYKFIVNEAFVREFMRGEEPLGKQINALMESMKPSENPFGEIIGVVGDVKEGSLDQRPAPTVYYVHAHLPYNQMMLVVRSAGDPVALAEPIRRIVHDLDPEQPVAEIRTMEDIVGQTLARQRFSAILLAGFSMAALLLAAVGIYGVLAYSVSERTREVGVRIALGAEPGGIVAMVMRDGLRLVIAGMALGIGGALALSNLLKTLLFGVGPHDPVTFILVPLVLMGAALLAAYVPARRASQVDPMQALRAQ